MALDFKKALVNHHLMLKKLKLFNFTSRSLNLFESYLPERTQRVLYNGKLSTSKQIKYGSPQSSILGPLLFLVFINDLPLVVTECKMNLYADDSLVYTSSECVTTIDDCLNREVMRISKWCEDNCMIINVDKSISMLICSNQKLSHQNQKHLSIKVNNLLVRRFYL